MPWFAGLVGMAAAGAALGWLYPSPKPLPQDPRTNMVLIPAGSFLYGAEKREVYLPAFYIDRYELSQAEYDQFLQYITRTGDHSRCNRSEPPTKNHTPSGWGAKALSDPRYPVVGLDYWDAYAYAHWAGKRLPTEEEWEKAARGTDGRLYPWGDEWDPERCNWGPAPGMARTLVPVDEMPEGQSPYGCYHMLGNAAEWTDSMFDPKLALHAGRGYCWRLGQLVPFVVTYRMYGPAHLRDDGSGLRCALDASRP
jgi:formylglycine-generating enzyme required for sulfatase activity